MTARAGCASMQLVGVGRVARSPPPRAPTLVVDDERRVDADGPGDSVAERRIVGRQLADVPDDRASPSALAHGHAHASSASAVCFGDLVAGVDVAERRPCRDRW